MKKIAISLGDPNGIGIEIALKAHDEIKQFCKPFYFINKALLQRAAKLLGCRIPDDFITCECGKDFELKPGKLSKKAGKFSFVSFANAFLNVKNHKADALVTLPINKQAWAKAGIKYHGHTEALSDFCKRDAIMMLGCEELFVGLFTDHQPLKSVPKSVKKKALARFLLSFAKASGFDKIGVLGLNPHAGDGGILGREDEKIVKAIKIANKVLGARVFSGPLVPDVAFNPLALKRTNRLVAMYHDQALAPLKALYFDSAINVSLALPIIRTSPDHGTAFDIAYKGFANITSYINAVKYAVIQANNKKRSK